MSYFIIIREFRTNDKAVCNELIHQGIMANLNTAFWSGISKELTFQLIVLTAAIMFIFVGVPFSYCASAIPLVMLGIYVTIYGTHWMKSAEYCSQGQRKMRCWVAEAYEPFFFTQAPKEVAYTLLTEKELDSSNMDLTSLNRKLIGTVSVDKHRNRAFSGWLQNLVVDTKFRRKGVGSALICAAVHYCEAEGFETLECVTTECQEVAREVLLHANFQLVQMYHKKIMMVSLEKYQLGIDLSPPL